MFFGSISSACDVSEIVSEWSVDVTSIESKLVVCAMSSASIECVYSSFNVVVESVDADVKETFVRAITGDVESRVRSVVVASPESIPSLGMWVLFSSTNVVFIT